MALPLVIGMSGASGVIYGIEMLKVLKDMDQPVHLVMSDAADLNIKIETDYDPDEVRAMADVCHNNNNLAAPLASGSFKTKGMIVCPCAIKSLSAIANSFNYNLLVRSADVTLKERRPLVLMVRETPLHKGHLELMSKAADLGAHILPPMPAFYHHPMTIQDLIRQSIGKALDLIGIEHQLFQRWGHEG